MRSSICRWVPNLVVVGWFWKQEWPGNAEARKCNCRGATCWTRVNARLAGWELVGRSIDCSVPSNNFENLCTLLQDRGSSVGMIRLKVKKAFTTSIFEEIVHLRKTLGRFGAASFRNEHEEK